MLKIYKNRLLEIIRESDIAPTEFTTNEMDMTTGINEFTIQFRETPLKFQVQTRSRDYHELRWNATKFSPNFPWCYKHNGGGWGGFADIESGLRSWLNQQVKAYIDEQILPDMWEQIEAQKSLISGTVLRNDETVAFSDDEKEQLRMSVREFRLLAEKTFEPSEKELEIIDNRLDYLTKAVDRLNRLDWKGLAVSTVISISIALSLDTERGRQLFNLFKQAFSGVLHLLQSGITG